MAPQRFEVVERVEWLGRTYESGEILEPVAPELGRVQTVQTAWGLHVPRQFQDPLGHTWKVVGGLGLSWPEAQMQFPDAGILQGLHDRKLRHLPPDHDRPWIE